MIDIILRAVGIFLCAFVGDVVWSLYIKHVGESNRISASNYGVAIGLCYIIGLYILINSMWYSVFHLAGLWFGTYYHLEMENIVLKLIAKFRNKKS